MNFQARFFAWLLLIVFTTSSHSLAGERISRSTTKRSTTERYTTERYTIYHERTFSADAVAADLLIARPGWLVETVVGAGLFVVSLPFAAASRSVNKTAHTLVVRPARATFRRTPGDFSTIE